MKTRLGDAVLLAAVLALLLPLSGCGVEETTPSVGIANPASEHCVRKGGKLEIAKDDSGEKGMCHLPDGTVVEEWELFRRDNSKQ